ncbi:MAG: hypothetical protein QS98_C0010G0055 [archaeon GW2011_AR3]|nr:MAG: hypothetical protein QS98_C0010G0055 [archaeon GW2011_AR3]MBS3110195.1 hypothetical protein [Candidatus Woesearchaeota archaeon]
MILIVDSREQKPYSEYFEKLKYKHELENLKVGDYSIRGYPGFAIERKELNDFIHSITVDRERFEKELLKAQKLEYFAVIIECTIYDIENRRYRSKIHPHSVLSTIFHWNIKYKIPFLFVESRTGGALAVIEMSKAYLKYQSDNNDQYQADI